MSTKIFISWSKGLSNEVGEVLKEWIPDVLSNVETFFSRDMDKGLDWFKKISEKLAESNFGIFILTRENITAPWILFEAGALYKRVGDCICPLLVDLSCEDLSNSPLRQFQITVLQEKEDMFKLIKTINGIREEKIDETRLQRIFDKFWQEFEENFSSIIYKKYPEKAIEQARYIVFQQLSFQDKPSKDQIVKRFESLSAEGIADISKHIDKERREDSLFTLSGLKDNKSRQDRKRQEISYLLPLLEALHGIIKEKDLQNPGLHWSYARLAFIYKDMPNPQWEKALELINEAIKHCSRSDLRSCLAKKLIYL